jgi:hypothetical protein
MEMAVRSMETAETAMETDGDGSEGTSRPSRVPEQRLLSPQNLSSMAAALRNYSRKMPISLGFFVRRLLIGEGVSSGVDQGGLTMGGRGQGLGCAPYCVVSFWPLSDSCLVLVLRPDKIGVSELVSSNSKNIFCVAFPKHKNSKNRELALWHLINRLVPEIT